MISRRINTFSIALLLLLSPYVGAANRIDIQVKGLDQELKDNVLAHLSASAPENMSLPEQKQLAVSESATRKLLADAEQEVLSALQPYGFYAPQISSELLTESSPWQMNLEIDRGKRTLYRNIDVSIEGEGKTSTKLKRLLSSTKPRRGEPVLHQQYTAFKARLQKLARERGFLDATYTTHTLEIHTADSVADVKLVLETGSRYYFGDITFDQSMLKGSLAAKFVKPSKGEPFESAKLIETQLRLSESEYFESVFVDIHRDEAQDGHIPVSIVAAPRKAGSYKLSVGYGTDTGPRAGIGADIRRVNRNGHKYLNQLQVSEVETTIASQYRVPIGDVRSEFLDYTANLSQQNINALDTREYRIAASLNQDRWGGRRKLSLTLLRENWSFDQRPSDSAILLAPAVEFSYKSSDDPFFIVKGFSYTLRATGAAENVLSDHSFARVDAYAKMVYPLSNRTRLLLRGELGAIATDDFDGLPPSIRFFAGGSQSVRGYGYNDLSPLDIIGNEVGGQYLTTASAEFDYLIYGGLGIAAFADAGNASDSLFDDVRYGAGLGLRYKSPAGIFRLDVAHPFDDPDKSVRIHLSFGIDL